MSLILLSLSHEADVFAKKPTAQGTKRKLDLPQSAENAYKLAKLDANNHSRSNGQTAQVEDEEDDDEVAGPARPEESEEPEDDEEGRFFGGGIGNGTADILDFMDEQDEDQSAPEKIDAAWVRKMALNFEKRISKNSELRAKFEDQPQKFMASEADLDADIKALSILSEHSGLYEEFAKLGCVNSLVGLLSHENADIAIDAIEIISELTAEDVEAEQDQWDSLVNAMLEADVLDLLAQNFERFEEKNESDRNGVYHSLSVLENFASRPSINERIAKTSLLSWILGRIKVKESPVGQNKQYAAEILAIFLQGSEASQKRLIDLDGVDVLMQLLSSYRKRDPPKGSEEEEYVENLFDCLTCIVDTYEGKEKFLEGEGVELSLIMLREGKMSRPRALRLLDHALGGRTGLIVCEKLVEAAGLKTVFGMFSKKQDNQTIEHLLGIFATLLRLLPANSAERIRTLAKFVEKDYEKIERIVSHRRDYVSRLRLVEDEIDQEKTSMSAEDAREMTDEWFSRRLDAGLFCLQTIDVVLAWLIAEDDGARRKIVALLADRDESLGNK
ncbi:MAG: DNA-dependent RNA polymerase II [Chaenotheca gracillima]|nr:MAG: DNA-dependent RNA polymerase II [Chaenotheca gracillima]